MMDVNIHVCPTCGGSLRVNVERQMYECPFCGVTFDYDYFREESVLGIAAQALKDNEFASADRAYDFLLEKEPDNFEALRGKALIAMDMPKIDDIGRIDLVTKIDYKKSCKEIDRAIGSSKQQDREYFTVMKDIADAGQEYNDEKAQLDTQKKEKDNSQSRFYDIVRERDTVCIYSSAKIRPKKAVILTICCYVICCLIIFLVYTLSMLNPYSKAEDLSQYNDFITYTTALEREEQRQSKYDEWEQTHQFSYYTLAWYMGITAAVFAFLAILLLVWGKYLNTLISKMRVDIDEQNGKIENTEKRVAEIKDRIAQNYDRLCELHPVSE